SEKYFSKYLKVVPNSEKYFERYKKEFRTPEKYFGSTKGSSELRKSTSKHQKTGSKALYKKLFTGKPVNPAKIMYCRSEGSYTAIITPTKTYMVTKNLKTLGQYLHGKFFFRCHRKFLINIRHLDHIGLKALCVTIGDQTIPINRKRVKGFPDVRGMILRQTQNLKIYRNFLL
ncbi:MAG: LytTR family transcriptional regulator, partial [Bacteroidales bacterium]|nr:LytTR family transcriptional regulator [Bacteroidales bacterium]